MTPLELVVLVVYAALILPMVCWVVVQWWRDRNQNKDK